MLGAMQRVRIVRAATAYPRYRLVQEDAARGLGLLLGEQRRVAALARGSRVRKRAFCLPPDDLPRLGSIEQRNAVYAREAPRLALAAASAALEGRAARPRFLAALSCTGYVVPGWDAQLAQELALPCDATRLPITTAGCSAGVLGLARAADYLRSRPGESALVVACELCSLAFQADAGDGNLTSALLFGDGAGAAVLEAGGRETGGLEVVESISVLAPASSSVLGFGLSDNGFYPLLGRELVELVPPATERALERLLRPRGLAAVDVGFWLLHPGGPRILSRLEAALGIDCARTRWSWDALAGHGNTSSAAVFEVISRYLADAAAPRGWGIVAAFGPGVTVEMLLVRRC
jgi:predicted naringenin-chalcone synthase